MCKLEDVTPQNLSFYDRHPTREFQQLPLQHQVSGAHKFGQG